MNNSTIQLSQILTFRQFMMWFVACWILTCVPLFVLHGVPGVDTPNHVARIHILGNLGSQPEFSEFYQAKWTLIPNLGIDLLLTPFVSLLGMNAVTMMKVFLCFVFGLNAFGFAWLNRERHGQWTAWGLCGFLLSYSYVLGFGFINYLFGLGVGLVLLAVEHRLRPKPVAHAALIGVGLPLLFVCHMMAMALFALAFLILKVVDPSERKRNWVGFALGISVTTILLLLLKGGQSQSIIWYASTVRHFSRILMPMSYGSFSLDLTFQVLIFVGLALAAYRKVVTLDRRFWIAGGVILLVAVLAPHFAFTSAFISARVPLWALLIAGALVKPNRIALPMIFSLLLARVSDITIRHLQYNNTFDLVARDLNNIEDGARLYQAAHVNADTLNPKSWNPSLLHVDCLTVLNGPLYVSNIFTLPSQQPLVLKPYLGNDYRDHYPKLNFPESVKSELKYVREHIERTKLDQPHPVAYLLFLKYPESESQYFAPSAQDGKALEKSERVEIVADRTRYALFRLLP